MKALDRVFSEMSQFTKTMSGLHSDFLSLLLRDIDRFLAETNNVYNQMQWQGYATLGLTAFGASLSVLGALIPKTPASAGTATDMLGQIAEKLRDNNFLRTTCKATAQGCTGLTSVSDTYFRSRTTETEAKRSLLKEVNVHNAQSGISAMDQNVALAQRAVQSMLDSKSKGG